MPENRWIDYMLWNPAYIGKIRWTPDGSRAVSKRDYTNESIDIIDGNWQPLISAELWEKVQGMLTEQKQIYPKHARRQQPIQYMLKGIVRCSACGGTLAMSAGTSGKQKNRYLQCCNYSRGGCHTSHAVIFPKIETAFLQGLKKAVKDEKFTMSPTVKKKTEKATVDYDKLISIEEKKLARAKEAYLAEIDTIEQYKQNKAEITKRIEDLNEMRDNETVDEVDVKAFAKKVSGIVEFIEREDVTEQAKNEALHTIIEKVVYEKAEGNLAIYFHDI